MMENKLLKALLKRSLSQLKECVFDGEDPHFKDENGNTYLHLSVFLKSVPLTEYFIEEGVQIDAKNSDNKVTALHRACRNGCETLVQLLVDNGADLYVKAKNLITPLHISAAFGHTKCTEILCSAMCDDLDQCDDQLHTPLHYASAGGHIRSVSSLLKHGCYPNTENIKGNRPLHFASAYGYKELCHILLEAGADIDAQNLQGQTALHLAVQANSQVVTHLIRKGANPNLKDSNGNTCSHIAIKNGNIDLLRLLMLDQRTDPSIQDDEMNTVMHVALKKGHFNLIPVMLPRAQDLTKQDATGCSVIIEAIRNHLEDLSLEILKACPSLANSCNHDFVTPLHLAAERGMKLLTQALLIAGAQVDATDTNGLTPSLYCAKNDSVLECLAMIEDIMVTPNKIETHKSISPFLFKSIKCVLISSGLFSLTTKLSMPVVWSSNDRL